VLKKKNADKNITKYAGAMPVIALTMPLHFFLPQDRRRPTPRFSAAGAGGVTSIETCFSAAAKLRQAIRSY
jgi:hypothetical protein